ncbi:hypothetical protein DH2020_017893 [Rehmannia glutinosa]|uniref:PLAC8 family protein n=1 Tax=Rehmannia glutinosa TaxID=99300 RepID=A0ABR0WJB7_REHGL
MANSEESNPLLPNQEQEPVTKTETKSATIPAGKNSGAPSHAAVPIGWTADGLPVGEPMTERSQWDSSIFSCLGRNDEFCSSDLEVCLLGSVAPCVLYGTNVERLGSNPGSCEALTRSCPCMGSFVEDEVQREQCETACDFGTHVFCHACALCQEGREVRRRLPHPGFNAQPVLVMIPPGGQSMGR